MSARRMVRQFACIVLVIGFMGCSQQASLRRTLREVGPETLRRESLEVCRDHFGARKPQEIPEASWPASARAFKPLGLWAEPDGAYVLLDSDADGERGIFLPRIVSDKDPVCGPKLTHVKLAEGIYSYETKR